jgi:lysophospholipase L1-like esterase
MAESVREIGRGRGALARLAGMAAVVAIAVALLGVLEIGVRVRDRLKFGRWMATPAEESYAQAKRLGEIVMPHPYLIGTLRPKSATSGRGSSVQVNSLGYRGAEFATPKPSGVVRVLAIGGSTTFDVCVSSDEATWTRRLEEALTRRYPGQRIEVVNGGHPGYTTVEMLLKLQLADLRLVAPDIVLAYVGLNDLQPSAAPDFRADYSAGHAEIQRRFLGFESRPPGLLERSHLLHKIHRKLGRSALDVPQTPRRAGPLPEAEAVYRARLGEIAGAVRRAGAEPVFLTQRLRFGADAPLSAADSVAAFRWLPYLTRDGIIRGMERYNDITRAAGESLGVPVVDVARDLPPAENEFADYCHWSDLGAERMGAFVAGALPESLFVPRGHI